ncbi:CDP-glycerol glycerophosphotransferase family protein [Streptomyces sp. NBC_00212]|uniref:bifunctional glycosyltransferase/CDP-glycerol:glycerophosphate glycerophosphotransferase n=1 Tax=Streptomyces sp. NBC_00212 TaxID=2975684 RepID=UPI00324E5D53
MPVPDVSVIVIVYNDADRLPTAVQSVLDQTLNSVEVLIVDDCSTDGSFELAQALEASHPGRIRAFQLPENSGAGGEPRNVGIGHATGRYIMFLDSDDVLEHNACRNLLEAAEQTRADIVSGLCVRLTQGTRTTKRTEWYPWLYRTTRTLESITELPDLFVWDTLSTNKCYRREFLVDNDLRFPKGMFYEDLMFIAEAYLAANRITLIPNQVYFWNVHEKATVKSVTNRRHEMTNYEHRLEIHRRIEALLEHNDLHGLRLAKDVKFLKHDLVLHLRDLPHRDEEYRAEFAALSREYLADLSPEAYDSVLPIQAICSYLLQQGDWDNLLPAVDALIRRNTVTSPLIERDGRIYWCGEHLDTADGAKFLDVTGLGYHTRPLTQLALGNRLTSYADDGRGKVRLGGSVVNPLGRIRPGAKLSGTLEFRARRTSLQSFRFPLASLKHAGQTLDWTAEADLARKLRPLGIIDVVWDVWVNLDVDGEKVPTRLGAGRIELESARPLRIRPRLTRLVADRLVPEISAKGNLSYLLTAEGQATVRTQELIGEALQSKAASLAKKGLRKARKAKKDLNSGDTKIRVYHEAFSKLPIRKGLVVFESHMGKQFSDSPKAIYDEMRRQGVQFDAVWSYDGAKPAGFPKDATLVKRWSYPYLRALAQAEFWIDNQGFPMKLTKRPGTTYIQTWHGSALKRMGFDVPQMKLLNRAGQATHQKVLDRFDHFLIRSEHDVRTLASGFRLRDEVLLRTGYPRNDALVAAREQEAGSGERVRGPIAEQLGIAADKKVLLYAPTFRASESGAVKKFELPFDVEEFADRFGDRYTLLIRSHYLNQVVLPPSVRGKVIDVSQGHDITPLLALADGLITDYSSLMFDYALLDRPMIFFAYDYEEYADETRGTYFDLRDKAPGPVVATESELFATVDGLKAADADYAGARERFATEFGEYDKGTAAQQIVAKFFTPGSGK